MDVRICGPNLKVQRKGSFHVHAERCPDLRQYGPGRRYGGDTNGMLEMIVEDATVWKVVQAVYDNGIIDEAIADGESREQVVERLTNDFWFAPCCSEHVPTGWSDDERTGDVYADGTPVPDERPRELVYEYWLSGTDITHETSNFKKYTSSGDDRLALFIEFSQAMRTLRPHQHINIVAHYADEYTP